MSHTLTIFGNKRSSLLASLAKCYKMRLLGIFQTLWFRSKLKNGVFMINKCDSINIIQCTKITKKVSFYKITISIRITILTLDTYFFQNWPNGQIIIFEVGWSGDKIKDMR